MQQANILQGESTACKQHGATESVVLTLALQRSLRCYSRVLQSTLVLPQKELALWYPPTERTSA
jgi:hypothetical protein